jgi:hypothetical protein
MRQPPLLALETVPDTFSPGVTSFSQRRRVPGEAPAWWGASAAGGCHPAGAATCTMLAHFGQFNI